MPNKNKGKKYEPKVSLKPLRFQDAMQLLLQTKRVKNSKKEPLSKEILQSDQTTEGEQK